MPDLTPEQLREHQLKAQREADDDLAKDARHLLRDIHDELIRFDRDPSKRTANAQKRLASLTVKNSESADNLARSVKRLTWVLVIMTGVILYYTVKLYERDSTQNERDDAQKHTELQTAQPPPVVVETKK